MNPADIKVRDVMTTNVITIPSDTSLSDARRIMDSNHLRRLPVMDRGKLVGMVTKDRLDKAGPSQLTTFSIHELTYLMSKIKVRDVMRKDVFTGTPDMTIKEATALGQSRRIGSMVVLEGNKIVGILTTNDIFYKVLNPILGLEVPASQK
jgi:acetoin utilization protein AcuB